MSPRARLLSSSVGMKLLIGVTGFALFVYLIIHIIGNLMVFFGPDVFNQYALHARRQPAHPDHRDRPAADLPGARLQDDQDVPRQPVGAAGRATSKKKFAGRPSRKTHRVRDDDLLRPLAAGLHRHPRQGVPVRRRVRVAGRRPRSLSSGDGKLRQPADGGVLRGQHARRRLASVARHLELAAVARASSIRDGRRACWSRARSIAVADRRRLHRHRRVGVSGWSPAREPDHARRARSPTARSRRSGIATSSR